MVEEQLGRAPVVTVTGTVNSGMMSAVAELVALGYRVERDDETFGYRIYAKEAQ